MGEKWRTSTENGQDYLLWCGDSGCVSQAGSGKVYHPGWYVWDFNEFVLAGDSFMKKHGKQKRRMSWCWWWGSIYIITYSLCCVWFSVMVTCSLKFSLLTELPVLSESTDPFYQTVTCLGCSWRCIFCRVIFWALRLNLMSSTFWDCAKYQSFLLLSRLLSTFVYPRFSRILELHCVTFFWQICVLLNMQHYCV